MSAHDRKNSVPEDRRYVAFHGSKSIKAKFLARVRAHAKADEIVKGQYWEGGKGCAVGCTIHGSTHKDYETEIGIPEMLARLEDTIFEGLPNDIAVKFPSLGPAGIAGSPFDSEPGTSLVFSLGQWSSFDRSGKRG